MLSGWLADPHTRGMNIDDPYTTELRQEILRKKSFLRQIYQEWYTSIAEVLPAGDEAVLELGSGAGFMSHFIPGLVTSDIFQCPRVKVVLNARRLPFLDGALRGIVMTNVLHHLPDVERFFAEATRCVKKGGVIAMLEPWVTPWSKLIYKRLHHEAFLPEADEWEFPTTGPLSGANGALPWIIFARDRMRFEQEFPQWQIRAIKPSMPFRYLVSGGMSLRSLMPGSSYAWWRALEKALQPWMGYLAMFALVVLSRTDNVFQQHKLVVIMSKTHGKRPE